MIKGICLVLVTQYGKFVVKQNLCKTEIRVNREICKREIHVNREICKREIHVKGKVM